MRNLVETRRTEQNRSKQKTETKTGGSEMMILSRMLSRRTDYCQTQHFQNVLHLAKIFVPRSVISQKKKKIGEHSGEEGQTALLKSKKTSKPGPNEVSGCSHCNAVHLQCGESLCSLALLPCLAITFAAEKCLHQVNRCECIAPVRLGVCRQMFRLIGRLIKRVRV